MRKIHEARTVNKGRKDRKINFEIKEFLHGRVRSWTSETKNSTKSSSDESQLPEEHPAPRGPTQNP
jgi:hypothetical protein